MKFGSSKSKLIVEHLIRKGDDKADTRLTDGPGKIRKALRRAKLSKSKAVEAELNTTKVEYGL